MDKFKHKKNLGQNFLQNNKIINQIIENVSISDNDLIIEIGPGDGILTKALKNFNANIIAYEIDGTLKPKLDLVVDNKTRIVYKDFLNADILNDVKNINYENLFVIANLPYYITTPIIEKTINLSVPVHTMILMMQKEVAERLAAKPGNRTYGSLTVYLNYYFEITKLFDVKKENFYPIPNVDSTVIKMEKRKEAFKVLNEPLFFKLVKDSFQQKRKTIKNNLKDYDLTIIEKVLKKNNLSLSSRAEQIDIAVFVAISNSLYSQI